MSGRRVSLVDLGEQTAGNMATPKASAPAPDPAPLATVPDAAATPTPEPAAEPDRTPDSAPAKVRPAKTKTKQPAKARYDELERKEARVRLDQYEALTALSRQLNRARNRQGERITENTLIRVAIDLLLSREGDVSGATEAELRKSVGL